MISLFQDHLTLIISPLISLMIDQIEHIPKVLTATCFHSQQSFKQKEDIKNMVKANALDILFISPETLDSAHF
jgi:ATP-dependent DNA helicase Q4